MATMNHLRILVMRVALCFTGLVVVASCLVTVVSQSEEDEFDLAVKQEIIDESASPAEQETVGSNAVEPGDVNVASLDEIAEAKIDKGKPKKSKKRKLSRKKSQSSGAPVVGAHAAANVLTGVPVVDDFIASNGLLLEAMAGAVVAAFVIVLLWGRSANRAIPLQFLSHFRGLLERQFQQLGVVSDATAEAKGNAAKEDVVDDFPFLTEANDVFKFFATGRRNVRGLVATFELVPRHNLLMWIYAMFTGMEDSLTLDFRLEPGAAKNMVIAVLPRKRVRTLMQQDHALREYAAEIPRDRLGEGVGKQLAVAADARVSAMKLLEYPLVMSKALKIVASSTGNSGAVFAAPKLGAVQDEDEEEDEDEEDDRTSQSALDILHQFAKGDREEGIPACFKQLLLTDHAKNASPSEASPMTTFALQMRLVLPTGGDFPAQIERLVQLALQLTDLVADLKGDPRELAACRKQRESKMIVQRQEQDRRRQEVEEAERRREKDARLAELEKKDPKKARQVRLREQKKMAKAMQKSGKMPTM